METIEAERKSLWAIGAQPARFEPATSLQVIMEAPSDVIAMAIVIRAIGAGHLRSTKTTRLYTAQEATRAMKKAGGASYAASSVK
ncbi:MAG TPA: hypothetical protein VHL58_00110 [Thermoanaerobaculia bacterium]|nr:hypothetical protein [Thermoanaerobaculia bacterium]